MLQKWCLRRQGYSYFFVDENPGNYLDEITFMFGSKSGQSINYKKVYGRKIGVLNESFSDHR